MTVFFIQKKKIFRRFDIWPPYDVCTYVCMYACCSVFFFKVFLCGMCVFVFIIRRNQSLQQSSMHVYDESFIIVTLKIYYYIFKKMKRSIYFYL